MDSLIYWRWSEAILRDGVWGDTPFFMGPLYPSVLAGLRSVLGNSVQSVLQVQAVGGAAAVALLADTGRHLTRPAVGIAVGVLAAFYEMAVFFDGLILMESLLFFMETLLLWLMVRHGSVQAASPLVWAGAGALVALIAEGRATAGLLIIPLLVSVMRPREHARKELVIRSSAAMVSFLVVATPPAIHNLRVSGEWIPFTYNAGLNLYIGNNPDATGGYVHVTGTHLIGARVGVGPDGWREADTREYLEKAEGLELGPTASSRYWARKAARYASDHPGRVLGLAVRKIGMMWNRREYPQIEHVDEYRTLAGPLGVPWLGAFLIVGPLGLAGLVFAPRLGPAGRFLVGYAIVMTLAAAPFFVTDRYRHHLVPAALLLAAVAADQAIRSLPRDERVRRRHVALALIAGCVVVNLPAPELERGKYEWGLAFDLGTRWAERGRPDLSLAQFEKAIRLERIGQVRRISGAERGDLYYAYANTLMQLQRADEALTWYEKATQAAPDHALAVRRLADLLAVRGPRACADSLYLTLESKVGGAPLALEGRGWVAAREGRLTDAELLFERAVEEDPHLYSAWGALIRVRIQMGRLGPAKAALEAASQSGISESARNAYLALVLAIGNETDAARQALALVPDSALNNDQTLADVVRAARKIVSR